MLISEPETVLTTADAQRSVAAALTARINDVVDVWLRLEGSGPLYGPAPTDPDELVSVVSGYLQPLALLLVDSLSGSDLHRSVYLDMRPYNLQELAPADRPSVIADELSTEVEALAELIPSEPRAVDVLMELHADLLGSPGDKAQRLLLIGDCIMPEIRAVSFRRLPWRRAAGVDAHQLPRRLQRIPRRGGRPADRADAADPDRPLAIQSQRDTRLRRTSGRRPKLSRSELRGPGGRMRGSASGGHRCDSKRDRRDDPRSLDGRRAQETTLPVYCPRARA